MNIRIEREALRTVLYGILSCQCPVTAKTETALFREFKSAGGKTAFSKTLYGYSLPESGKDAFAAFC